MPNHSVELPGLDRDWPGYCMYPIGYHWTNENTIDLRIHFHKNISPCCVHVLPVAAEKQCKVVELNLSILKRN